MLAGIGKQLRALRFVIRIVSLSFFRRNDTAGLVLTC
jgi:hypothetical protein